MKNHCAFSKNHSCPLWTDYELTCYELEEANSLCHGNWIEIERQYKYIQTLQKILSDNDQKLKKVSPTLEDGYVCALRNI